MSEPLLFAQQEEQKKGLFTPYAILIVDDDPEIHAITKMALADFSLDERPLTFTSAYSSEEAKQILQQSQEYAMMLLDVVMESDHAGLDLVKWTREELKNNMIRIVLRTGQPGQAPEEEVIAKYEIDDYKEKTELTYRKLVTLMYSSLRAYRDLQAIEHYKLGLERIIEASAEVFKARSIHQLSQGILEQLVALLTRSNKAVYYHIEGFTASSNSFKPFHIIAATKAFEQFIGETVDATQPNPKIIDLEVVSKLIHSANPVCFLVKDKTYYGVYKTRENHLYLLYIHGVDRLDETDKKLLDMFMNNTAIAFEHTHILNQ